MMPRRAALLWVLAAGCGRWGYDAVDGGPGDDGGGDDGAAIDAPIDHLIHQYHLNGNYTDDLGGPDLTPRGGSFVAGGYQFGPDQGLSVSGAMPDHVYTVDLVFQFHDITGWRKILDFKDLSSDNGFYDYETALQFVVVAGTTFATGPNNAFAVDTQLQVTLTRDAAGQVDGYVDRAHAFQFQDTAEVAALQAPGAVAHFFVDDNGTGMSEAGGGVVRRIRIFDAPLAEADIPP